MRTPKRFSISKCHLRRRCTLFELIGLYCQRLPTLQRGLSAIADLLVYSWLLYVY